MKNATKLIIVGLIIFGSACTSSKKLTEEALYFKNITDSSLQKSNDTADPVVQKGDILYIGVLTPNEESMKKFNQPNFYAGALNSGGAAANQTANTLGYLVDNEGNIIFPQLGKIHVEGLTKSIITKYITDYLKSELIDPIVTIRFLNYRITILGEVARPGTYSIPNERVTILDALGLCGDLTLYGRRNTVRVIREKDGKRETGFIDLNKGDIFSSPYYYLQQNDVVYVEMNNRKILNTDNATIRNVGLVVSILTAVSIIVSILK
ncbi:MAG: polysaccharide biosynthesis/export family protein [Agriterribacter sp.]